MLLTSKQKSEKWFSAKPHLTHGLQNRIYFDQYSPRFSKQLLQALPLTAHSNSSLAQKLFHLLSVLTQIIETRAESKRPGSKQSPCHHWVSPLASNCISWASKSDALRHVPASGGKSSGHREGGVLSEKAATDPEQRQPDYPVLVKYILRDTGYTKAGYTEIFMTK